MGRWASPSPTSHHHLHHHHHQSSSAPTPVIICNTTKHRRQQTTKHYRLPYSFRCKWPKTFPVQFLPDLGPFDKYLLVVVQTWLKRPKTVTPERMLRWRLRTWTSSPSSSSSLAPPLSSPSSLSSSTIGSVRQEEEKKRAPALQPPYSAPAVLQPLLTLLQRVPAPRNSI